MRPWELFYFCFLLSIPKQVSALIDRSSLRCTISIYLSPSFPFICMPAYRLSRTNRAPRISCKTFVPHMRFTQCCEGSCVTQTGLKDKNCGHLFRRMNEWAVAAQARIFHVQQEAFTDIVLANARTQKGVERAAMTAGWMEYADLREESKHNKETEAIQRTVPVGLCIDDGGGVGWCYERIFSCASLLYRLSLLFSSLFPLLSPVSLLFSF